MAVINIKPKASEAPKQNHEDFIAPISLYRFCYTPLTNSNLLGGYMKSGKGCRAAIAAPVFLR
jgi:hypothetical protein